MAATVPSRRIHIIGGPGSGKTTLGRQLRQELNIPLYELDKVAFAGPHVTLRPLTQRLDCVGTIARQPTWITEGLFLGWTDELLRAADTIIWLDETSWSRAFVRILVRFLLGGVQEAKRQPGARKFTRFSDYRRHLAQLVSVFFSSRAYYRRRISRDLDSHRALTRATTLQQLVPHWNKVIHYRNTRQAARLIRTLRQDTSLPAGDTPLVSIVIDNYNYGRYLTRAIESALHQTYRPVEVIVVDDGSDDGSQDIIAAYGDRIIPVLKQNGGQASALNAGFARSRGEIVIFLDADDILQSDIVRQVVLAFRSHDNVAKVQYRMEVVDSAGRPTGQIKPATHLPLPGGDLHRHFLTFPDDMTWMATSGNAFARRVLDRLLPAPEEAYGAVGIDWYLSHLCPLLGNVVSLDSVGAYYRLHESNSYERLDFDLDQIRRTIGYMKSTHPYILQLGRELGLVYAEGNNPVSESVAFIAHRLISLKLDPLCHPLPGDTIPGLFRRGVAATGRRFDVSLPMKFLYALWFTLMVLAPRPAAAWLADRFLFPEKRPHVNRVLGLLHRTGRSRLTPVG